MSVKSNHFFSVLPMSRGNNFSNEIIFIKVKLIRNRNTGDGGNPKHLEKGVLVLKKK